MAITSVSTDLYPVIQGSWNVDPKLKAPRGANCKFAWLVGELRPSVDLLNLIGHLDLVMFRNFNILSGYD